MRLPKRSQSHFLATLPLVATAVACAGGAPPTLKLSNQVAAVGTELTVNLDATSSNGGHLTYSFRAPDVMDLAQGNAGITVSPSGEGVFRWTPLAADVGDHSFDFVVSDGDGNTTVTIDITVKTAIGSGTAPVFVEPINGGTNFDVSKMPCLDFDVMVTDPDTAIVMIGQHGIDGATLMATGEQSAHFHWCPTPEQKMQKVNTLTLSADDGGENPTVTKQYLIVLTGGDNGSMCPGAAPVITYTPTNQTTRLDLTPVATITDDKGIKAAPLFFVSTTDPGTTPDLSLMWPMTMTQTSGNALNGQYTVTVPNPVASMADGTQATLYYVISTTDADDPGGTCDHTTQSPVYSMTVTAGGTATYGLCAACSADAQCGSGNECVTVGSTGASYCLQACGAGCPTGYYCSNNTIGSIDGAQATQCVPQSGTCSAPSGTCQDDNWERNDSLADASANPVMNPGDYPLVSCPSTSNTWGANDDWFRIAVGQDSRVDLQMMGNAETDLDLHLYAADGTTVTSSESLQPDEEINECLKAGTYFVKVNGFGQARNEYFLNYASNPETCITTCTDDTYEDDDTYSQARSVYSGYSAATNMICPNDDDWYKITLQANQTLTVDLAFTQNDPSQNLDVHLYQNGEDLWPCDTYNPGMCDPAHGQGTTSNEHATFTVPSTCTSGCDYYVVVRGYNGASNSYGISIEAL
jgi:hypothetical protein